MPPAAPTLKGMTRTRDLKAGHFIFEFATPGIGHVLKQAGCDFAVLDTEHSGFGVETTKHVLRYMEAAALPTVVRAPSRRYEDVARICDAGAEGVMLPMVSTVEEAEEIVRGMKYTPRGRRGVVVRSAVDRYTTGPTVEKLAAANERTTLFARQAPHLRRLRDARRGLTRPPPAPPAERDPVGPRTSPPRFGRPAARRAPPDSPGHRAVHFGGSHEEPSSS